jgi:hypothetical protein
MGAVGKGFSLLLVIVLAVSSLLMVEPAHAQSIIKPSIPEFTVKILDHSYYVPPTYTTDPYTGTKTMTHEAYIAQNGTIEVAIKSQKFTQYYDSENNLVRLYLRVEYKGHFALEWTYYPGNDGFYANYSQYSVASDFGSTFIRFGFGEYTFGGEDRTIDTPPSIGGPSGGQIDFKVEAFIGYSTRMQYDSIFGQKSNDVYTGESSGWSNTQTITIPETTNTSLNPSPTVPEFSSAIVLVIMLIVLLLAMSVFKRKSRLIK